MMRMDGERGKEMKFVQPTFEGHRLAANSLRPMAGPEAACPRVDIQWARVAARATTGPVQPACASRGTDKRIIDERPPRRRADCAPAMAEPRALRANSPAMPPDLLGLVKRMLMSAT